MTSRNLLIIKIVLIALSLFLGYKVYRIIMEPIEFEKIEAKRYGEVKSSLEKLRDVQLAYKDEKGRFCGSLDELIAFLDKGQLTIYERKDSSFMYYDKRYQKDMNKDTTIIRVIGSESVKASLFSEDFDAESLRMIPYSDNKPFEVAAGFLSRNNVKVSVFEVKASNSAIFGDLIDTEYDQFFEESAALTVGSLEEPTVSGNWK